MPIPPLVANHRMWMPRTYGLVSGGVGPRHMCDDKPYPRQSIRCSALHYSGKKHSGMPPSDQIVAVTVSMDCKNRKVRSRKPANLRFNQHYCHCRQHHGSRRPIVPSSKPRGQFRPGLAARHGRQERGIVLVHRQREEDPRLDIWTGQYHCSYGDPSNIGG